MARVGVLGAERLLADRDGALVERLGLGPGRASLVVERHLAQCGCFETGPVPLGGPGRRERVWQERPDHGPVGVLLRRTWQRRIHQSHGGLGVGLGRRLVEPVARDCLDQAVDDDRSPPQR